MASIPKRREYKVETLPDSFMPALTQQNLLILQTYKTHKERTQSNHTMVASISPLSVYNPNLLRLVPLSLPFSLYICIKPQYTIAVPNSLLSLHSPSILWWGLKNYQYHVEVFRVGLGFRV